MAEGRVQWAFWPEGYAPASNTEDRATGIWIPNATGIDDEQESEDEDDEGDDESDSLLVPWNKLNLNGRTPEQERSISEAVISVRNHARHVDPYEEWESKIRRDAFVRDGGPSEQATH